VSDARRGRCGCKITPDGSRSYRTWGRIRYALRHWPGLIALLDDGRIEMGMNTVEQAIGPITLTGSAQAPIVKSNLAPSLPPYMRGRMR
jgi:hypothetical protein